MGFNLRKPDPEPSVRACELLLGPQDGLILEVEDRKMKTYKAKVYFANTSVVDHIRNVTECKVGNQGALELRMTHLHGEAVKIYAKDHWRHIELCPTKNKD